MLRVATLLSLLAVTACLGVALAGAANKSYNCSLVTRGVIASVLDVHLVSSTSNPVPRTTHPAGSSGWSCAYFGTHRGRPLVLLEYAFGVGPSQFARSADAPGDHRVSGIANGAFYFTGKPFPGEVSLSVLDGRTGFEIQAYVSLARIETLAKKITPVART